MADRRRRRRVKSSEDSEELSEGSVEEQEVEKASEAESIDETKEIVVADSEYESAEEEGEEEKEIVQKEVTEPEESQPKVDNGEDDINPVDEEGGVEDTADETIIEGEYIEGEDDEDEDEDEDEELEESWKEGERQQGDGQESQIQQLKEKVLDDDEDKRNPQYIPKKGGFYEHDDRLFDNEEKEEEKKPKKKLWKDEGKWTHDRFKEEEQRPKSRDELVTVYGYDIRNEEGPPRARRRRRYGRGPNKYTRKWEDEDAYAKMASRRITVDVLRGRGRGRIRIRGRSRGRGRGSYSNDEYGRTSWPNQGYHPVIKSTDESQKTEENDIRTSTESCTNLTSTSSSTSSVSVPPTVVSPTTTVTSPNDKLSSGEIELSEHSEKVPRDNSLVATNKNIKPFTNNGILLTNKENVTEKQTQTDIKPRGGGRGGRGGIPSRGMGERRTFQMGNRKENYKMTEAVRDTSRIVKGMDKLSIRDFKDGKQSRETRKETNIPQERRQATVPPRLQDGAGATSNRPKRYSSQRQRNVPDSASFQSSPPPQNQGQIPPRFYDRGVEYQTVAETGYQPPLYADAPAASAPPQQGNTPQLLPPPPPQTFQGFNPSYQEPYAMRPMANPPRIFAPVTMATGTMATGQPVMPAPYISPNNNMMNYGPPPANYTQYTFQQYPSPPQTVTTPQEIYRGGMAYYNTHSQPAPMRTHVKRPKAAIPIVPPPEMEENDKKKDGLEDNDSEVLVEDEIVVEENQVVTPQVIVEG